MDRCIEYPAKRGSVRVTVVGSGEGVVSFMPGYSHT